jgi:hypothetical protein
MRRLPSLIALVVLCSFSFAQSPHGKDFSTNCSDCHTTEGWKIDRKSLAFNHDTLGFPLEGQHKMLDCRMCHKTLLFTNTKTECMSCHTDIHYQTVGFECERCHTPKSWIVENITEIHQVSRFPLVGPHVTADCYSCHPSESLLRFEPLGVECFDCHKDKYYATTQPNHVEGGYSTNCEECHLMTSFDWSGANINHSFFPLTGGHGSIDCIACHTTGVFSKIPAECVSCHQADYNSTTDPNHTTLGFSTNCNDCHDLTPGWKPARYSDHDNQFFPIYSGSHNGTWNSCTDCHPNTGNYAIFSCINCHNNQADLNDKHGDVGGYAYNDQACYECHPSGSAESSFNHNASNFPLTGVHITTECSACHTNGFAGTPTICFACHEPEYNQTTNPNHNTIGIATECETCHTTDPDWKPALYPNHNEKYPLLGAHATAANCFSCHEGNYVNTPNLCYGCHSSDYNQTSNPNHTAAQFSTSCETCHNEVAWVPATFDHDGQYFPIYSGKHQGEWDVCSDCHTNPGNYAIYTCTSTCHLPGPTNDGHNDVGGYTYNDPACFECHPDGSAEGAFNHQTSIFPLTGAHLTTDCIQCHTNGFSGTPTICFACHETDFNQSVNPNHGAIGIPTDCATCHTTNPDWQPATFPIHNNYYQLQGAHAAIANNCFTCHEGNYINTPNLCYGCHSNDYNQTTNPNHVAAQFPTNCESCHSETAWTPATFDHDGQFFPINSGKHLGTWDVCSDCHTNPADYAIYTCITCHQQGPTGEDHNGVGGYSYNSPACLECHPDGSADGAFNHNNSIFPLTGAHITTECISCHANGYAGTPTICFACHEPDFDQSVNPNHNVLGIPNDCITCHTTNPGWQPAAFPIHNNYYPLIGEHIPIANDCNSCHSGDYNSTPNVCSGCHMDKYNQSTNPDHDAIAIPTDCETCHTPSPNWQPASFPIHNNYYALTGAHLTIANDCYTCHQGDYNNTPNVCVGCHLSDYNQTTNPDHDAIGIGTDCAMCHTTNPGWQPASFPIHNQYWPLTGAHVNVDCYSCHEGNYNSTPNTCAGCHMDDYLGTTDPNHAAAGFPTTCEECHTTVAWVPSTFDHDGQYFPIYSGSHNGVWNTCSQCHPNPSNFSVFTCTTSCHPQGETDSQHDGVSGYSYNSDACYACHPTGQSGGKMQRLQYKSN